MEYGEEVVKEFDQRTMKNLETIERLVKDGQEVYEVTQLINSCLGLLVFPQQEYLERIGRIPIEELRRS